MDKKELIVINSGFNTPRIKKRIQKLNLKYKIRLLYFTRPNDNEKLRSSSIELAASSRKIQVIDNRKYFKRIFIYLNFLRQLISLKSKQYYFFGADFQFFLPFLKGRKYLEIGDLRIADLKGVKKILFYGYEKVTLRFVDKIILTSEYHYTNYYNRYFKREQVLIIRNKLSRVDYLKNVTRKKPVSGSKVKIGLFGMLRYEVPMDFLIEVVKEHSAKYELIIYGISNCKYSIHYLEELDKNNYNISWKGKYLYPNDLEKIYNEIDINFVVYDNTLPNVRNAIPNKLYESVLFNRPILCATETKFGEEVSKMDIGLQIPIDSYKNFKDALLKIDKMDIDNWATNMNAIQKEEIFEDDSQLNLL